MDLEYTESTLTGPTGAPGVGIAEQELVESPRVKSSEQALEAKMRKLAGRLVAAQRLPVRNGVWDTVMAMRSTYDGLRNEYGGEMGFKRFDSLYENVVGMRIYDLGLKVLSSIKPS